MMRNKRVLNRMVRNRKAQFYLFTMIILLAMVTTFIIARPAPAEVDKSFDHFFENIDREAEYVVNNAILNDVNVSTEIDTFLGNVQENARTKRITMSYFYLLVNKTHFYFSNEIGSAVRLLDYNLTLADGESSLQTRSDIDKIAFQVEKGLPDLSSFIYKFYITEEDNQVLYLLFGKRGEQYDLHIRDNT